MTQGQILCVPMILVGLYLIWWAYSGGQAELGKKGVE
jgi:prolipoprotein diacylglyceryltransferase